MTIGDLLDNVARAADDDSAVFRNSARRWLNIVRAHIASRARWKGATRIDSFDTDATKTDGLYTLTRYEHLVEDWLYDETNVVTIISESHALLNGVDVDKSVTGPPSYWGDAGSDDNGNRKIYLWPIPDGTYTIRFTGLANFTDLDADDDDLKIDPYFGKVSDWSMIFAAGLRYHQLDDSDEDAQQTLIQLRIFDKLVDSKKTTNHISPVHSLRLSNVRNRSGRSATGRFNPAHYRNN